MFSRFTQRVFNHSLYDVFAHILSICVQQSYQTPEENERGMRVSAKTKDTYPGLLRLWQADPADKHS